MLKYIKRFYIKVKFLYIIWLAHLFNLNLIKNF